MRNLGDLLNSIRSSDPVNGLTHRFYRYPARFSPRFARSAIEQFTERGDVVLDPFMGGGTTVVEALSIGRKCVGSDINPLSRFISRVKTTPLSRGDIDALIDWGHLLNRAMTLRSPSPHEPKWDGYHQHVPWWLRKTLEIALEFADELYSDRTREFARCSLMKTAQWALDCKSVLPMKAEFLQHHERDLIAMLSSQAEFKNALRSAFDSPVRDVWRHRRLLTTPAAELASNGRYPASWPAPKLVLTSPPYRGVHILYHRWQVNGRRETPAPYWLAGCRDGQGEAYYTFGSRHTKSDTYLTLARASFEGLAGLLDEDSIVVQLVGCSNPSAQLAPYLKTLGDAGFEEVPIRRTGGRGRIKRGVPNRKWYADMQGAIAASREYLLIHRKAKPTATFSK